jgi:hypothetical protein
VSQPFQGTQSHAIDLDSQLRMFSYPRRRVGTNDIHAAYALPWQ